MTAAIIIVLAWIIRPNPKIEIAATQLAQTANNIRLFYQTKPGYWGLNTETVIKNNLEAGGMLIDGKLQNAFGKPVIIGEDEQGSIIMPGTRHFTVTFPELNKSECTVMAAFRLNERESLSLLQMIISNGEQRYEFNWGGSNPLPITKQDAAKYCGKTILFPGALNKVLFFMTKVIKRNNKYGESQNCNKILTCYNYDRMQLN